MKNIFKATIAVAVIAAIGLGSVKAYNSYTTELADNSLFSENVLAESECVIFYNGRVYVDCVGNEGNCTTKFGQVTITCAGRLRAI